MTTTVVSDGSSPPPQLAYDNLAPNVGGFGASGNWEFSTFATSSETVELTFDYRRANINGTGLQTLLSGEAEPQDIELDVASGHMYWTDTTNREVLRVNLNGSGRTVIILASQFCAGTRPFGVALDLVERKLYWTVSDASPHRIERSNLDGTGIEVVSNGFVRDVVGLDLVRIP